MKIEKVLTKEQSIKETTGSAYDQMLQMGNCFTDDNGTRLTREECIEFVWSRFTSEECLKPINRK